MNESDANLEVLRHMLEELYLRVRKGEAREEEAIKLSMVVDSLIFDITKKLDNNSNKRIPRLKDPDK